MVSCTVADSHFQNRENQLCSRCPRSDFEIYVSEANEGTENNVSIAESAILFDFLSVNLLTSVLTRLVCGLCCVFSTRTFATSCKDSNVPVTRFRPAAEKSEDMPKDANLVTQQKV